jgi:hypothetical protein
MMFAISLSVLIISYALFNSDPSEEYLIGGLIPGFLSYLPIIKVGKKNQSLQLLNVFEHKRNRILKALSVISDDEIDKLNEEFYRIVSIKTA